MMPLWRVFSMGSLCIQRSNNTMIIPVFIKGHGDPMDTWYPFDWTLIPQNYPTSEEPVYVTPNLIYHLNPNIKLILVIRNPVEM